MQNESVGAHLHAFYRNKDTVQIHLHAVIPYITISVSIDIWDFYFCIMPSFFDIAVSGAGKGKLRAFRKYTEKLEYQTICPFLGRLIIDLECIAV